MIKLNNQKVDLQSFHQNILASEIYAKEVISSDGSLGLLKEYHKAVSSKFYSENPTFTQKIKFYLGGINDQVECEIEKDKTYLKYKEVDLFKLSKKLDLGLSKDINEVYTSQLCILSQLQNLTQKIKKGKIAGLAITFIWTLGLAIKVGLDYRNNCSNAIAIPRAAYDQHFKECPIYKPFEYFKNLTQLFVYPLIVTVGTLAAIKAHDLTPYIFGATHKDKKGEAVNILDRVSKVKDRLIEKIYTFQIEPMLEINPAMSSVASAG